MVYRLSHSFSNISSPVAQPVAASVCFIASLFPISVGIQPPLHISGYILLIYSLDCLSAALSCYYVITMSKYSYFDTVSLIEAIEKRPPIWDKSADYSNESRKKAWDEIIGVMGEKNMTKTEKRLLGWKLQQRWKNLRTCFGRELKRQRSCGSGAGRKSEYVYYRNLFFLTNVINTTDRDNCEPEHVYFHEDEPIPSQSTDSQCLKELPQTPGGNILTHPDKKRVKRNANEYEEPFSDKDADEDRLFLLSLLETLKRVPINKKMGVKIKMMSILNETLS